MIVTGCERSGTTVIGKAIAEKFSLPYVHEVYGGQSAVMKHSLNMEQNIKHLELLDHLYPKARWFYVIRDGREVCRSMVQKIWQHVPHTMSLDEAIQQWNYINETCYGFGGAEIIRYEDFVDEPISEWRGYFTVQQQKYMEQNLNLEQYGYSRSWH